MHRRQQQQHKEEKEEEEQSYELVLGARVEMPLCAYATLFVAHNNYTNEKKRKREEKPKTSPKLGFSFAGLLSYQNNKANS